MIWKIIKDFPNYSVSNTGLVKNNIRNKLLKLEKHKSGYIRVTLLNKGGLDND